MHVRTNIHWSKYRLFNIFWKIFQLFSVIRRTVFPDRGNILPIISIQNGTASLSTKFFSFSGSLRIPIRCHEYEILRSHPTPHKSNFAYRSSVWLTFPPCNPCLVMSSISPSILSSSFLALSNSSFVSYQMNPKSLIIHHSLQRKKSIHALTVFHTFLIPRGLSV